MEAIKPQDIKRGMVILDEASERAYTALADATHVDSGKDSERFYVKGIALANWGGVCEYNPTYLPGDSELYVISHPAPFALPDQAPPTPMISWLPNSVEECVKDLLRESE